MSDTGQGRGLADFIGAWRLEREIRHADGSVARFSGRAEWRPEGDGARCVETGTLTLPDGTAVQAGRNYLWDADLNVQFGDGRFFHAVPPAGGAAAHDCPPDRYEATYDFADWPRWRCTWRVRGPRKDYVMLGTYARAD
ncbi:DUF6314 family protein [Citreimonas sp.]|uniref:DUF6314 family protein n=1 Tax=Citreimonas sp. TaxID=3036715 RepID=UPI0035C83FA0